MSVSEFGGRSKKMGRLSLAGGGQSSSMVNSMPDIGSMTASDMYGNSMIGSMRQSFGPQS
jgi:hypothetical protein